MENEREIEQKIAASEEKSAAADAKPPEKGAGSAGGRKKKKRKSRSNQNKNSPSGQSRTAALPHPEAEAAEAEKQTATAEAAEAAEPAEKAGQAATPDREAAEDKAETAGKAAPAAEPERPVAAAKQQAAKEAAQAVPKNAPGEAPAAPPEAEPEPKQKTQPGEGRGAAETPAGGAQRPKKGKKAKNRKKQGVPGRLTVEEILSEIDAVRPADGQPAAKKRDAAPQAAEPTEKAAQLKREEKAQPGAEQTATAEAAEAAEPAAKTGQTAASGREAAKDKAETEPAGKEEPAAELERPEAAAEQQTAKEAAQAVPKNAPAAKPEAETETPQPGAEQETAEPPANGMQPASPQPEGKPRRARKAGKADGLSEVEELLDEVLGGKKPLLSVTISKKKHRARKTQGAADGAASPQDAEKAHGAAQSEPQPAGAEKPGTKAAESGAVSKPEADGKAGAAAQPAQPEPAETPQAPGAESESGAAPKANEKPRTGSGKRKRKPHKKPAQPEQTRPEQTPSEPAEPQADKPAEPAQKPETPDKIPPVQKATEPEEKTAGETQKAGTAQQAQGHPARRRRPLLAAVILLLVCVVGAGGYLYWLSTKPPVIEQIDVSDALNEDNTVTMTVQLVSPYPFRTDIWCAVTQGDAPPDPDDPAWQRAQDGLCSFDVEAGDHAVFAMDSRGNLGIPGSETVEINECISIVLDKETLYLPLEGKERLAATLFILGDVPETVSWSSEDERVATVDENGFVRAVAEGETDIIAQSADGKTASAHVMVTDLIKLPNIDTASKPLLVGNPYTEEEAHLLDEILATKVEQAGYGTRAGAVAAARFLALEFEYRVPYFFENGRLSPHEGRPYCDGEGRYYHQGLYLSEDKFDDLSYVRFGPATWGQLLLNWETKYAFVGGNRYPNGLDCSGFVCWCLINGGTDVGDMGAGDEYGNNDLCDLAEKKWITTELMQSDEIQVGDLIAEDGHMAIIIGLTEDRIYIAESLVTSVRVTNYPRDNSVRRGPYTYVIPMGDVYAAEGNVTSYWEIEEPAG